jgi:hypothetical protein
VISLLVLRGPGHCTIRSAATLVVILAAINAGGCTTAIPTKRVAARMFSFGKDQSKKVQSVLVAVEALDATLKDLPVDLVPEFEKAAQELFDVYRSRETVTPQILSLRSGFSGLQSRSNAVTCRCRIHGCQPGPKEC